MMTVRLASRQRKAKGLAARQSLQPPEMVGLGG